MKIIVTKFCLLALITSVAVTSTKAQDTSAGFTNFIRQVQLPYEPDRITRDVYVQQTSEPEGKRSALAINPNGARFELHTVRASPLTSYLLDTKYVSAFIPVVSVVIRSEDPYTAIPRTRADRPFHVDISIEGLRDGEDEPVASRQVTILRHVQSYGEGDGINIDRSQASLISQNTITMNGDSTLTYAVSSIPSGDLTKIHGEERFSVFSIDDNQVPATQLASMFVQVWPVADGGISGITSGETLKFAAPTITVVANDLYPGSTVYAQVYRGEQSNGTDGVIVHGSSEVLSSYTVPQDRVYTLSDWDRMIDSDGVWTIELLTATPFGIDLLDHVTFNVDRTIKVNGTVTTIE